MSNPEGINQYSGAGGGAGQATPEHLSTGHGVELLTAKFLSQQQRTDIHDLSHAGKIQGPKDHHTHGGDGFGSFKPLGATPGWSRSDVRGRRPL